MKTIFSFFALVSLLSLFAVYPVNASHLIGGEITYHCIGGNTYHIVFTVYRNCIGIAMPASISVNLLSNSCGQSITATATQVSGTGTDILPTCSGTLNTCHGGTYPGIQKWQYYLDYTLPHQCSDWKFSYSLSARNAAINTLQNPASHNLYVEANLNDSLFNHDSPVFSSEPVFFTCVGATRVIDYSVINGCDSFVYSLIQPRGNNFVDTVPYNTGYDSINFISSTPSPSLDSLTGLLTIHPTTVEIGPGVVLVREYRNGVLIGSIMRDTQYYTQGGCNIVTYPPQLSGINGTNQYSATFAANKITCFALFSSDSDSTRSTKLALDVSLPGDTLIVDTLFNQSGIFCWMPLISDTGSCPHCFSVTVKDDTCPVNTRNYKYCINVVDSGFILNTNVIDSKFYVTVSPNPSSKSATVTLHGSPSLLHCQFILFDALGRTVMNTVMDQTELTIDGTLLPAGIYFYSVRENDKMMATGKIVVTE